MVEIRSEHADHSVRLAIHGERSSDDAWVRSEAALPIPVRGHGPRVARLTRSLSRTMIVEHVWDMDYDGLTNIVDVYIRHLRSKIDDRYPQKLIQTVRG